MIYGKLYLDDELRDYFNSDIKLLEKSINWVEIIVLYSFIE